MKLNITFVKRTERISKAGKPFTSISIKATQYGEKYLGGFGNKDNANWKAGDEVEVEKVEQKGEYLNFEMPKAQPKGGVETLALSHKLDQVQSQLRSIIDHLSGKNRLDTTSAGTPMPTFIPNTSEQSREFSQKMEDYDGLDQLDPSTI